ncbi:MAG TPA: hypothetical protein V6C89_20855 [Drouetiella sp.]
MSATEGGTSGQDNRALLVVEVALGMRRPSLFRGRMELSALIAVAMEMLRAADNNRKRSNISAP